MKPSEIFKPFEDWSYGDESYFGLCVKDGKIYTPNPDMDDEEYDEWHIETWDKGWLIECGYCAEAAVEVYKGKISTREFFVELMKNVDRGFDIEKCEE